MAKKFNYRVMQKHDIQANWEKAINFIPLKGELIVYDAEPENGINYPRFKIGNGILNAETGLVEGTKINDLPFVVLSEGEIIGEGASARGINTQAGNRAFKILNIEKIDKYTDITHLFLQEVYHFPVGESESTITHIWNADGPTEVGFSNGGLSWWNPDVCNFEELEGLGIKVGDKYLTNITEANQDGSQQIISIKHINPNVIENSHKITVRGDVTQGATPYIIDDLLQVECKLHYNNCLKITNIEVENNNSIITVVPVDNRVLDSNIQMDDPTGQNMDEDWVYVVGKDGAEVSPQLTSAFAAGKNSKATGFASTVFGRDNIASGNYSTVVGRGNVGGYASLVAGVYSEAGNGGMALGNTVRALGDSSVATGVKTYARAASSRAGGRDSEALSEFTVAEGLGVIAGLKQGQVVHGKYNVRSDSDLFVIGDGTAANKRHNALRITEDYKVFLNNDTIELANVEQVDNVLVGAKAINDKNNKATGVMALATGSGTTASGQGSLAGGVGSQATARSAISLGEYNKATVQGAFAGGINTEANGFGTIALGYGVKTINSAPVYGQIAVGKYNVPNAYSLFMVGNGTSKDDRKNVFEVRNDGSAYLETQGNENNSVVIKSHLDSRIADIVNQLASAGLQREVVETLPEINNANETTIYMVANNSENEQNVYDEYMLINGIWEMIGSTQVDLSNYHTKEEISSIIENIPGEKTVDNGEIFNLYEPIYEDFIEDDTVATYKFENISVGPYTTASGKGTQAGNNAFKILNIENIKPYKDIDIGTSGLDVYTAVFFEPGEVLAKFDHINPLSNPELYFTIDGSGSYFIAIGTSFYDENVNVIANKVAEHGLIIGDYYLINIADTDTNSSGGNDVISIKHKIADAETWNVTLRGNVLETATPYEIGDKVQIECKGTFIDVLQIENIETDIISEETVSILKISPIDPSRFYGKNDLVLQAEDPNNAKNWLYVVGKNNNAESNPQSIGAFATGYNTVATGRGAFVGGESNQALGRYSAAVGRQNTVGYAGFASGRWNTVLSQHGFASGNSNTVLGSTSGAALGCENTVLASYATAIGRENQIGSVAAYSLVTGYGNKSQSEAQLIAGKFSQTSKDDLFVVGNGTSDSNRNNAFALDKNGNLKIQGMIYANNSEVITKKNNIGQLTEKGGVILNNAVGNSTCAAIGVGAFAVGNNSQANNRSAIAMGERAVAKYIATMAVGVDTLAAGYATIALGYGTQTATGSTNIIGGQTAVGRYNKTASDAMFVVGNGYQNENGEWIRQNAFEVKNDGSAILQTQGLKPNSVVIKSYLDEALANVNNGGSSIKNGQLILDGGLEIRTTNPYSEDNSPTFNYIKIGKNIDDDNPLEIQVWDGNVVFGHGHIDFNLRDMCRLTMDLSKGTNFYGGTKMHIDAEDLQLSGTNVTVKRWDNNLTDDSILSKKEIDTSIKAGLNKLEYTLNKDLVRVYPSGIVDVYSNFIEGERVYELTLINHVIEDDYTNAYEFTFTDISDNSYQIICFYYAGFGENVNNSNFIENNKYLIDASINKTNYIDSYVLNSAYMIKDSTEMELVDKITGEKYKIYIENGILKTEKA